MEERILITCKSQDVPGADEDKATLLTNQACQIRWNRDFDTTLGDRFTMEGDISPGVRCFILVDNGPVDSIDYKTSFFRWDGEKLVAHPLPALIRSKLEQRFQFNPANRPQDIFYTDQEYEKTFGRKKFEKLVQAREERQDNAKRFAPTT